MTTFTAMTWNVENFFAPKIDAPMEDHVTYAFKLNLLANVITQADPDVIGLQEVGGEEPLHDLHLDPALREGERGAQAGHRATEHERRLHHGDASHVVARLVEAGLTRLGPVSRSETLMVAVQDAVEAVAAGVVGEVRRSPVLRVAGEA